MSFLDWPLKFKAAFRECGTVVSIPAACNGSGITPVAVCRSPVYPYVLRVHLLRFDAICLTRDPAVYGYGVDVLEDNTVLVIARSVIHYGDHVLPVAPSGAVLCDLFAGCVAYRSAVVSARGS
jgi:hypothetical protein